MSSAMSIRACGSRESRLAARKLSGTRQRRRIAYRAWIRNALPQPEAHAGTLAVGAFHLQEAVHHRKQPCYNGKSQTYPLNILTSLFVHSQETRGYPRDVLLTHAGARVLDFNAQPAAVAVRLPADLYLHPIRALCTSPRWMSDRSVSWLCERCLHGASWEYPGRNQAAARYLFCLRGIPRKKRYQKAWKPQSSSFPQYGKSLPVSISVKSIMSLIIASRVLPASADIFRIPRDLFVPGLTQHHFIEAQHGVDRRAYLMRDSAQEFCLDLAGALCRRHGLLRLVTGVAEFLHGSLEHLEIRGLHRKHQHHQTDGYREQRKQHVRENKLGQPVRRSVREYTRIPKCAAHC